MGESSTPDKLLDAAERLFAEEGIAAVSLRRIISEAGVNVASVHYHFGSKEELIRAVMRRRISAVNEERLSELEKLKVTFGSDAIPLNDLFRAFLAPALALGHDSTGGGRDFFRFIARVHADTSPEVQAELFAQLGGIIQTFLKEISRSTQHLSENERAMRLAFSAGAMVQAILLPLKPMFMEKFFGGGESLDEMLEMLIRFCSGGFEAAGGGI